MAQWKSELFGCFEDVPVCLLGWCCSCYLFGQNAQQITGDETIISCVKYALLAGCCLQCLVHKPQRIKFRNDRNLEEKPNDLVATCICSPCANCQEARELKQGGGSSGSRITTQPR
jgi:Cys-rich protein (TIGR01571 family)